MKRLPRELWFLHTWAPKLSITPLVRDEREVMVQRTHDAPNMSKFACQLAPALQPGEVGRIGYSCEGGAFVDEFYWRVNVPRYTRHLTLQVRHEAATLSRCSATEDLPDGSELVATDDILWDQGEEAVSMTVTRDYLTPNQAVTLRWEI
jgi:hypothetical protein